MKIVFILANSADPDERLHKVAFQLGLHYLPRYLFNGIQNEKVKDKRAMTCDFQQCGILTSVDSGEPV